MKRKKKNESPPFNKWVKNLHQLAGAITVLFFNLFCSTYTETDTHWTMAQQKKSIEKSERERDVEYCTVITDWFVIFQSITL